VIFLKGQNKKLHVLPLLLLLFFPLFFKSPQSSPKKESPILSLIPSSICHINS
jgi:hypothetical protein